MADLNPAHQLSIVNQCGVVAKIVTIRKVAPVFVNGKFDSVRVQALVRANYGQAQAIVFNQPFQVDPLAHLTVVYLRDPDDDDAIWGHALVTLVRYNWGLFFVKPGLTLHTTVQVHNADPQQKIWDKDCIGLATATRVTLREIG